MNCKDCNLEYWWWGHMVMVNDKLWDKICDDYHDHICSECMEERLGRGITTDDFMEPNLPCNNSWLADKNKKVTIKFGRTK